MLMPNNFWVIQSFKWFFKYSFDAGELYLCLCMCMNINMYKEYRVFSIYFQ